MSEERINNANKVAAASLIIGMLAWLALVFGIIVNSGNLALGSPILAGIGLLLSIIAYFMGSAHHGNLILGFLSNLLILIALFLFLSVLSKMHC